MNLVHKMVQNQVLNNCNFPMPEQSEQLLEMDQDQMIHHLSLFHPKTSFMFTSTLLHKFTYRKTSPCILCYWTIKFWCWWGKKWRIFLPNWFILFKIFAHRLDHFFMVNTNTYNITYSIIYGVCRLKICLPDTTILSGVKWVLIKLYNISLVICPGW